MLMQIYPGVQVLAPRRFTYKASSEWLPRPHSQAILITYLGKSGIPLVLPLQIDHCHHVSDDAALINS